MVSNSNLWCSSQRWTTLRRSTDYNWYTSNATYMFLHYIHLKLSKISYFGGKKIIDTKHKKPKRGNKNWRLFAWCHAKLQIVLVQLHYLLQQAAIVRNLPCAWGVQQKLLGVGVFHPSERHKSQFRWNHRHRHHHHHHHYHHHHPVSESKIFETNKRFKRFWQLTHMHNVRYLHNHPFCCVWVNTEYGGYVIIYIYT